MILRRATLRAVGLGLATAALVMMSPAAGRAAPSETPSEVATSVSSSSAPAPSAAAAHALGQAYLYLRIFEDSLIVRVEVERKDLVRALDLDWDLEQPYDSTLVDRDLARIREYVEDNFFVEVAGQRRSFTFRQVDALTLPFADFIRLTYAMDDGWTAVPDELDASLTVLFETDSNHRNFLLIEHNWRTATFNNEAEHSFIFSPRTPSTTLDLTSSSLLRGFIGFIWLGVWHILIGTDHILFLVALILPSVLRRESGRWVPVDDFKTALWNIVAVVTFFTIAHSVTLSMAALDLIRVPITPIETIIAASIGIAAWANLAPRLQVREWMIAFVFGLFHGFGFASVMGEIGAGREHLVLTLLGFNLGVEVGQVAIICAIFPFLYLLRRTRLYLLMMKWGSIALIGIAGLWVAERMFGFDVPLRKGARTLYETLFGGNAV